MQHRLVLFLALLALGFSGCRTLAETEAAYDPDREIEAILEAMDEELGAREVRALRRRAEDIVMRTPRHARALSTAGILAYEDDDPENAQVLLDRALEIDSTVPGAAVTRARVAIDQGNLRLATRVLGDAARRSPADPLVRETLAGVLFMEGRFDESMTRIDQAEALGAPAWRVAFHRGLIQESLGRWDAAEAQYELALEHCPDDPATQERLTGLRAARR